MLYKLDKNKNPYPALAEDICDEDFKPENRRVGMDEINGKLISTVFLGIDHNYYGGPPILFETMVFENKESCNDIYCERYCTWSDAVEGHKRAVERFTIYE